MLYNLVIDGVSVLSNVTYKTATNYADGMRYLGTGKDFFIEPALK